MYKLNNTKRENNINDTHKKYNEYDKEQQWISIYTSILKGNKDRFPYGFWVDNPEEKCVVLLKYLVMDVLKWNKQYTLENLNGKILAKYRLMTILKYLKDLYTVINIIYPDVTNYKEIKYSRHNTKWSEEEIENQRKLRNKNEEFDYLEIYKKVLNNELVNIPQHFWNENSAKICLDYVFNDILKWNKKEIYENVTSKMLIDNFKMGRIIGPNFDLLKVIKILYPDTIESDIKSLKSRLVLSNIHKENIKKISSYEDTIEIYKMVLNNQLDKFPYNFWDNNKAKLCLEYIVYDVLKWSKEEFLSNISIDFVNKYKLVVPMKYIWEGSLINLVNELYPNTSKFEVKNISKSWNDVETQKEFIKWLLEEKLKWNREDIKEKFSRELFTKEYSGFLKHGINGDLVSIIELTYPNEIYAYEIKSLSLKKTYWNDKLDLMAKLIRDKIHEANIDIEDIPKKITTRKVRAMGIPNSIFIYFDKSIYKMIDFAYPNTFKKDEFR